MVRDDTGADVLHGAGRRAALATVGGELEGRSSSAARSATPRSIVAGVDRAKRATILSSARVHIRTSKDAVGDSLFYREVPLPFLTAVQDPSRIRWRFGTIDMEAGPPIVLQNLPVCGNCHSFADNGSVLGLDVDYGNDKGAYAHHAGRRSTW